MDSLTENGGPAIPGAPTRGVLDSLRHARQTWRTGKPSHLLAWRTDPCAEPWRDATSRDESPPARPFGVRCRRQAKHCLPPFQRTETRFEILKGSIKKQKAMPSLGVSVAIIHKGKVLLTKREDFEVWCLPGGGVDAGESPKEAAVREAKEETGLEVKLTRMVGTYARPAWLERGDRTILFAAKVAGGELKPQASEVIDIGFFDPRKLPEPLIWWYEEQIRDALEEKTGVARIQHVPQPFGKGVSMRELYRLRDRALIPRQQFFLQHFGQTPRQLVSHPKRIPFAGWFWRGDKLPNAL